jgi:hypothetical protein
MLLSAHRGSPEARPTDASHGDVTLGRYEALLSRPPKVLKIAARRYKAGLALPIAGADQIN